jgi:hypothetical protein
MIHLWLVFDTKFKYWIKMINRSDFRFSLSFFLVYRSVLLFSKFLKTYFFNCNWLIFDKSKYLCRLISLVFVKIGWFSWGFKTMAMISSKLTSEHSVLGWPLFSLFIRLFSVASRRGCGKMSGRLVHTNDAKNRESTAARRCHTSVRYAGWFLQNEHRLAYA